MSLLPMFLLREHGANISNSPTKREDKREGSKAIQGPPQLSLISTVTPPPSHPTPTPVVYLYLMLLSKPLKSDHAFLWEVFFRSVP